MIDNSLRFRVSSESHKVYKNLCEKNAIFHTMSDLFFWCVILGYANEKERSSLGNASKQVFTWGVFSDEIQKPVLKMIAVEVKDDFTILNGNDVTSLNDFKDILEELAEAGLTKLLDEIEEIDHESLFSVLIKYLPQ